MTGTGCRCVLAETTFHGRFVFQARSMQWMDMQTGMAW